jgi:hypothetical protein
LARYGWPDEKAGTVGLRITGKGAQVVVQHVHLPIGISGQHALPDVVVDTPANGGVKLGTARHIIDIEATPESPEPPNSDAFEHHRRRSPGAGTHRPRSFPRSNPVTRRRLIGLRAKAARYDPSGHYHV